MWLSARKGKLEITTVLCSALSDRCRRKMSLHHEAIRHAIRMAIENEQVANPLTDQHMKLGYLLTSRRPLLGRFRLPFLKLVLSRAFITLPDILCDVSNDAEKLEKVREVFSSPQLEKTLVSHKEKVAMSLNGRVDAKATKYVKMTGKVKTSKTLEVDFGQMYAREVDRKSFHEAIDGLHVDMDKWKELKVRNPSSLYVVVRTEISEKLVCNRLVKTEGEGEVGVKENPIGAHGVAGGGMKGEDDLHFDRQGLGVIGFRCARLHVDPATKKLSLVKYDFTSRGWIDRDTTDGRAAPQNDEDDEEILGMDVVCLGRALGFFSDTARIREMDWIKQTSLYFSRCIRTRESYSVCLVT